VKLSHIPEKAKQITRLDTPLFSPKDNKQKQIARCKQTRSPRVGFERDRAIFLSITLNNFKTKLVSNTE